MANHPLKIKPPFPSDNRVPEDVVPKPFHPPPSPEDRAPKVRQKFRRKPPVVEAEQYTGTVIDGVCMCPLAVTRGPHIHGRFQAILTLQVGDWIMPDEVEPSLYKVVRAADMSNEYDPD